MFQSLLLLVLSFNEVRTALARDIRKLISFNPYCYWSYLLTLYRVKEYKGTDNILVSILIVTGPIF